MEPAKSQTTTDISVSASKSVETKGDTPLTRGKDGKFLPGHSGNPNGRPKGRKNVITMLKQDLEIALRENLCENDVQNVVKAMLEQALSGNVGAGKLILDKVLSNARETEDEKETGGGLKIIIENATIDALQNTQTIVESTAEEITHEQSEQSEP